MAVGCRPSTELAVTGSASLASLPANTPPPHGGGGAFGRLEGRKKQLVNRHRQGARQRRKEEDYFRRAVPRIALIFVVEFTILMITFDSIIISTQFSLGR